ncbi:hypothetical protein BN11_4710003 [Nostocoides australiense Ben110]|uniref:Uncharacterized protein n=1 Tax=Nostocoides australiense Ben110 TaxID=1193182 RepID=W6JZQ0_9MICO|nr:hypothetical protein [Tetrasphaera australiensis]CCH74697.1 hypothetical protein BN11_4710003 [Tetrasphaera australiensis Ben110]
MMPDRRDPDTAEDDLQTESELLKGVRFAISGSAGDLDEDAIDEALGVTPLISEGSDDSDTA